MSVNELGREGGTHKKGKLGRGKRAGRVVEVVSGRLAVGVKEKKRCVGIVVVGVGTNVGCL